MGNTSEQAIRSVFIGVLKFDHSSPVNIVGAFGISDSDFSKLDQEIDQTTTRLRASQGGQLMASLEVFHQLHCLVR